MTCNYHQLILIDYLREKEERERERERERAKKKSNTIDPRFC